MSVDRCYVDPDVRRPVGSAALILSGGRPQVNLGLVMLQGTMMQP